MPLLTDEHRDYFRAAVRIAPGRPLLSIFGDLQRRRLLILSLPEAADPAHDDLKLPKLYQRLRAELQEAYAGPRGEDGPYALKPKHNQLEAEEIANARRLLDEVPGVNLHDLLMDALIDPERASAVLDAIARNDPERDAMRATWRSERAALNEFHAALKPPVGMFASFFSGIVFDWWGSRSTVLFILMLIMLMYWVMFSDTFDAFMWRYWRFEWRFP